MIHVSAIIREQFKTLARASGWRKARRIYLQAHPDCAVCNRKAAQVHHIQPFHLRPDLELDQNNLIGFCADHHLLFGHLMHWRAHNPHVVWDAVEWKAKVQSRMWASISCIENTKKLNIMQRIMDWIWK